MATGSQSVSTTEPSSLHPTGFAETILITTIFLSTFCVIAVVLRTWQRIRARSFRVDDAVTWVGLKFFTLVQYAVVAYGTTVGIGTPDAMVPTVAMYNSSLRAKYWFETTYVLAMGFSKVSICSTLLRINKGTDNWKTTWALWFVMAAVASSGIGYFLFYVTRCDFNAECRDSEETLLALCFFWVGLYIIVDITLAVVPWFIIRDLNMKKSLKLSIVVILGMGGVACLASILRIPSKLDTAGDNAILNFLYKLGSIIIWSEVETGLSIIACCLPMLRKLLMSFDNDPPSDTPCRHVYYRPGSPGHSRESPSNNTERLPHDPCPNCADREKGLNTLSPPAPEGNYHHCQ